MKPASLRMKLATLVEGGWWMCVMSFHTVVIRVLAVVEHSFY